MRGKYSYAAFLLDAAGTEITEQTLTNTLESAGVEVNSAQAAAFARSSKSEDVEIDGFDGINEKNSECLYTLLLLRTAGTEITEEIINNTLQSAGADVDSEAVGTILRTFEGELEEQTIREALERAEIDPDSSFKHSKPDDDSTVIERVKEGRAWEAGSWSFFQQVIEVASDKQQSSKSASESAERTDEESQDKQHFSETATDSGEQTVRPDSNKKHPPELVPESPDLTVSYSELNGKDVIGGGANANVRKMTTNKSNGEITVAIKEPRFSGTLHTNEVKRILEEAKTWSRLDDHDYIVGVINYGNEPLPWIAMEYMDGGHLGEKSGEMELQQAVWTALSVTKGVRHAHRRGVAHLDLKPENILFRTVEDAWDVPKVADWGLSKHLLEHSKSIEGYTPTYSAPEQLDDGYGKADDITDVYQLGAVFYELFTGSPPYDGDRTGKIIRQALTEEPTPPSVIADVPEVLDDILLTALAKEKDERYDDIIYLRDDLKDLFENIYQSE